MSQRHSLILEVNGQMRNALVAPRLLLCDFLREDLELTGTHVGCQVGACGACTVLLDGKPVRSCLLFALQAEGRAIRTVEALGTEQALHPVQEAFEEQHGLQCGFCTPGILITVAHFLESHPEPTDEEIMAVLAGHLCRCTGYRNILAAVRAAATQIARDKAAASPRPPG
ncbi:MAG TPA: (2Fe-2S)-binding protein [Opitutaceae bacterium]|jgi:carbon-monoxide dehydrogenase small subunit|nr:(2Fe-2S)-binding protein [Opitutaceae bacterium]